MRIPLFVLIIGEMFIGYASAGPSTRVADPVWIAVRVYDGSGLSRGDLAAAMRTTEAILAAASVHVEWHPCDVGGSAISRVCTVPLAQHEFVLRWVAGEVSDRDDRELPLGYSLIDTRLHRGSLATIHPNRVAWLAAAAGMDVRTLLGRAIAHELGHLLLGTNEHRNAGIMRALWSCEALRRNAPDDWMFTARDIVDIRTATRTPVPANTVAASTSGAHGDARRIQGSGLRRQRLRASGYGLRATDYRPTDHGRVLAAGSSGSH